MREILAWTVKCSLLIFTIAGYTLTTERPRVSVCSIREFCVLFGDPGYIDKRIELDLHTEDAVYMGVIKTSVTYYIL